MRAVLSEIQTAENEKYEDNIEVNSLMKAYVKHYNV